jgi:hypothetical protein
MAKTADFKPGMKTDGEEVDFLLLSPAAQDCMVTVRVEYGVSLISDHLSVFTNFVVKAPQAPQAIVQPLPKQPTSQPQKQVVTPKPQNIPQPIPTQNTVPKPVIQQPKPVVQPTVPKPVVQPTTPKNPTQQQPTGGLQPRPRPNPTTSTTLKAPVTVITKGTYYIQSRWGLLCADANTGLRQCGPGEAPTKWDIDMDFSGKYMITCPLGILFMHTKQKSSRGYGWAFGLYTASRPANIIDDVVIQTNGDTAMTVMFGNSHLDAHGTQAGALFGSMPATSTSQHFTFHPTK